ncbi:MerR family transcriptional regulator [Dehalogenimonas alkenigignens]|uniref:MerR family transcriptional regulator n=1 Tax=Dehalogenimonas alkenigignens TaxID=1217799 RepID=UPI001F0BB7CE|nr:MerR family transcriptional regulator [Dehalogenimonas alkenigignens]
MIPEFYQIGELARRAAVSARTIRFYEEKGLLGAPARTSGGMRLYDERDVNRVKIIRRLHHVGLGLEDIKSLLGVSEDAPRAERVEKTLSVLNIEAERSRQKIAQLQAESLEREEAISLVSKCRECAVESCPIHCPPQHHVI